MKLSLLLFAVLALPVLGWAEPIAEVLELKNKATIPQAILEQYDTDTIAESLVAWVKNDREKKEKKNATPIYDFKKQSRIVIAFNLKNLESIQEKCFLNQHQTGTSNAYLGKDRLIQENKMLGLTLGTTEKEKEILPKYAYLFIDGSPMEKDNAIVTDYGGVFAKINDRVKERSTFTSGDSLVIRAMPKDLMTFDYKLYKEGQIKRNYTAYWEAQIWGSLCMDDVDYFLIGCTVKFPEDQIERLKKVTGKPVYRCIKKSEGWKTYSVLPGEGPL